MTPTNSPSQTPPQGRGSAAPVGPQAPGRQREAASTRVLRLSRLPDRRAEGPFTAGKGSGAGTGSAGPPAGAAGVWRRREGSCRRGGRSWRGRAGGGRAARRGAGRLRARRSVRPRARAARPPAPALLCRRRRGRRLSNFSSSRDRPDPGAAPGPAPSRPRPWTRWPGCCPRFCCSARSSTAAPGERAPGPRCAGAALGGESRACQAPAAGMEPRANPCSSGARVFPHPQAPTVSVPHPPMTPPPRLPRGPSSPNSPRRCPWARAAAMF